MQAPAFDLDSALERCDGDRDLLQGMAELFFEQSGKLMPQIAQAVNQRDASAVERLAHKLKGSIGNFSAPQAFTAAQRLEDMGRSGDLSQTTEAHAHLEQSVAGLQAALAELMADHPVAN